MKDRMKRYRDSTPSADEVQSCIDHIKTAVDVDEWAKIRCENLLKRMIPVKPKGEHTNKVCGVCGCRIRSGAGSSSFVYDTVCRNCFTVIDWGNA